MSKTGITRKKEMISKQEQQNENNQPLHWMKGTV